MKRKLIFITLFIIIYALSSCKKENVIAPTQADEVTTELQKIITQNGIDRVIPWNDKSGFPTSISSTFGKYWSFSNGFITIGGFGGSPDSYTWNLLYLDKYYLSNVLLADGTSTPALILHFRS
jgi:hypothetical protein